MKMINKIALLAGILAFSPIGSLAQQAEGRPNFLLILTDDHGWTSTSAQMDRNDARSKSDYHETPHIARLAESGMRFSQGYAPAAICTPTRRSILFGQTQLRQGPDEQFDQRYHPYDKGYLTIPRMLKETDSRYRTAHYGKWHQKTGIYSPEDFGFDQSDGRTSNDDGNTWEYKDEKWKKTFLVDTPKKIERISGRGASFIRRNAEAGNPFFLQLSYYATHVDIQTKPESHSRFSRKPRGRTHDHPGYAGMLFDLDTGIGQALEQLRISGVADSTYVFFLADNGGVEFIPPSANKLAHPDANGRLQRNHPLRGGKWVLYEGGIRVPFLVSGPGIPANSQSDTPVVGYDLLPTIAELAGYPKRLPAEIDGGSFAGILRNGSDAVERQTEGLVFHRYASYLHSAIRVGDFKLLKFWKDHPNHEAGIELYDLSQDMGETRDLSEKMPGEAKKLESLLMNYIKKVNGNVTGNLE